MGSSTPTPWARGNASVRQVVKTQNRDMAQQRRETVKVINPNVFPSDGGDLIIPGRREMPTKAGAVLTVNADEDAYELQVPVSGGGGPVGMAEIASVGGVSLDAGQFLLRDAVTYAAPRDPFAGTPGASALPLSSWCAVDGSEPWRINLAAGWYSLTVSFYLVWPAQADAPPALSLYMQGGNANAYNEASVFAVSHTSDLLTPRWGVKQVASNGPTFITATDGVWFECYGRGGNPTGPSIEGSVRWNIVKLA